MRALETGWQGQGGGDCRRCAPFLSRLPPRVRSVPVVKARPLAGVASERTRLAGMDGSREREWEEDDDAMLSLDDEAPLAWRDSPRRPEVELLEMGRVFKAPMSTPLERPAGPGLDGRGAVELKDDELGATPLPTRFPTRLSPARRGGRCCPAVVCWTAWCGTRVEEQGNVKEIHVADKLRAPEGRSFRILGTQTAHGSRL